jgi:spermidine/putrescine-binding protein
MAYNADKLKTAPTSWADFWDTKTFPGKRGLRKGAKYTLEFALMADGVAPKDVYKVLAARTARTAPSRNSMNSSRRSSGGKPAPSRRSTWPRVTW